MPRFLVGEDGLLSEVEVSDQASWYASICGDMEPLAMEAQIMLMRAYNVLNNDVPFQRRKNVSKARYSVLRLLVQHDDMRMPMGEIIQGLHVSATNITKLVDGLEKDDLVRRAFDSSDKRKIWVELTPEGRDVVLETCPEVARHVDSLWQGLSIEERRILIHLLAKFRLSILTADSEERVVAMTSAASLTREAVPV